MPAADDYFAASPNAATLDGPPRHAAAPIELVRPHRARWRRSIVAGVPVVISVAAGTFILASSHSKRPAAFVDTRPLRLPAAIGDMPLGTYPSGKTLVISNPRWAAKYHGNSFEAAIYGKDRVAVTLIAGRGPIGDAVTDDLGPTAAKHRVFGDVTCADALYRGPTMSPTLRNQATPTIDICWYSTATLSVGIAFSGTDDDSASHAAALDAALPIIENNA